MAFTKEIVLPSGVMGTYWRVTSISDKNIDTKRCRATLSCYIDKAHRDDGRLPVTSKTVDVVLDDVGTDERPQVYDKAREYRGAPFQEPFFGDAVDA